MQNRLIEKRLDQLRERFYTYEMNLFKAKLGYEREEFLQLFEKISQIFVLLNSKGTRTRLLGRRLDQLEASRDRNLPGSECDESDKSTCDDSAQSMSMNARNVASSHCML